MRASFRWVRATRIPPACAYSAREKSPIAQSLKLVVEGMQKSSSNVFVHDELGSIHDPCYFVQFVEWASEWGLRYLAEVDLATMALEGLPDSAQPLLQQLAPDFIETQQLIDFLVNRSGRTSVLVRDDARIARDLAEGELTELQFTTSLAETEMRHTAKDPTIFETRKGARFSLEDPGMLAVVRRLLDEGPEPVAFSDLETWSAAEGHAPADLTRSLLALIGKGWAEPRLPIG